MNHEELRIVAALVALCKQLDIHCAVQVGAEDGYEAGEIAKATGCRAVAIEADERCIAHAVEGVEFHTALIGGEDLDEVPFYRHSSFGLSTKVSREGEGEELLALPQRRLDTFCRELDITPDALIIDTEGTTLDVLEGSTGVIDGVRLVYAECQSSVIRPGVRLVGEVNEWLAVRGFVQHEGLPAYDAGGQGNYCWRRA